jgi:bacterioferritin-associated ferredoxin
MGTTRRMRSFSGLDSSSGDAVSVRVELLEQFYGFFAPSRLRVITRSREDAKSCRKMHACARHVSESRDRHRPALSRSRGNCRDCRYRCRLPRPHPRGRGRRSANRDGPSSAECPPGSRRCAILLTHLAMDGNDELEPHPAIRGLRTVCRCNNIKYRTIERAIRRGACTLTQIAACTTATTGHCGGSCTPEVQEMLDEHAPPSKLSQPPPKPAAAPDAWWIRKK